MQRIMGFGLEVVDLHLVVPRVGGEPTEPEALPVWSLTQAGRNLATR